MDGLLAVYYKTKHILMNMRTSAALFKGFVVSLFLCGVIAVPSAQAAELVTTSQMNSQSMLVQEKTIEMLREYVKYLQMNLIRKLEAQVAILKSQAQTQR